MKPALNVAVFSPSSLAAYQAAQYIQTLLLAGVAQLTVHSDPSLGGITVVSPTGASK